MYESVMQTSQFPRCVVPFGAVALHDGPVGVHVKELLTNPRLSIAGSLVGMVHLLTAHLFHENLDSVSMLRPCCDHFGRKDPCMATALSRNQDDIHGLP